MKNLIKEMEKEFELQKFNWRWLDMNKSDFESSDKFLKSFIFQDYTKKIVEGMLKVVEAEMLDKIYYIGHDLPQVKEDVRDKFVMLGYPQKFLDDLRSFLIDKEIT